MEDKETIECHFEIILRNIYIVLLLILFNLFENWKRLLETIINLNKVQ